MNDTEQPGGDRFTALWADVEAALQRHGYRLPSDRVRAEQARSSAFWALHDVAAAYESRSES